MEVLAIIPARSGSKSVIDKNIRIVAEKPMLAWSIEHAKASRLINRVIVSTDSERYADIAREYGAEVPFIRPAEYATDTALDIDVFRHALNWLAENEGYHPDIVVQLRPTYPKRNPKDIDAMIEMLANAPEADSVRSVALAGEVPYKMWVLPDNVSAREWSSRIQRAELENEATAQQGGVSGAEYGGDASALQSSGSSAAREGEAPALQADRSGACIGRLWPLIYDIPECYNMPRQELPQVFYQNACIDVMRASAVLEKKSMTGDCILGYLMSENLDIDTEIELLKAEAEMLRAENERLKAHCGEMQ